MLNEREALKRKAESEYIRKKNVLEVEYKKTLEAIDRVFALMGENDDAELAPNDGGFEKPPTVQQATSSDIRSIIGRINGDFTVGDIRQKAAEMTPPLEVSKNILHNVLKQQREKKQIEVIKASKGRAPATYRKIEGGLKGFFDMNKIKNEGSEPSNRSEPSL